jgi:uncharacterized membrane protein YqhA
LWSISKYEGIVEHLLFFTRMVVVVMGKMVTVIIIYIIKCYSEVSQCVIFVWNIRKNYKTYLLTYVDINRR